MAEVSKKSYKVNSPVVHDGVKYDQGDSVELTDREAASLAGVVGDGGELPLFNPPAVNNPEGFPEKEPEVGLPEPEPTPPIVPKKAK